MKRGEIYIAELIPRSGSEQTGRRPVIIVSHDGFNQTQNWRSIIVVPISTSNNQVKRSLTTIFIEQGTGGLTQNSVVLCHQITTLNRSKLKQKIGELSDDKLFEIEQGLKAAMDMS
jgi:mRNA interferase MazF